MKNETDYLSNLNMGYLSNLNMGYCCINTELRDLGIFCSRTCRLDTVKTKGLSYLYELAEKNIKDLPAMFRWNYRNNIFLYRMSSEMFPFVSHPDFHEIYDLNQFSDLLKSIGDIARHYKQTINFHPSAYNQLASIRESVVEKTIIDIDLHAKILDLMGCGKDSVIIIHGGSKTDGKENSLKRLSTNFLRLSQSARDRLVLENCEMAYSTEDLLPISENLKVPIVIDYHHHNINRGSIETDEQLNSITLKVLKVWQFRGITPLFHLSESRKGVRLTDNITIRRAHSDYVEKLPNSLIFILKSGVKINLDIEAKMKEQAVLHLKKKLNIF
jgi:UV DNA damage endonuclease